MLAFFRGHSPGSRAARLAMGIAIIAAGLALRRYGYGLNLPFVVVKYGGSALWGAMVYFLIAVLAPNSRRASIACAAMVISTAVELFRLYHTPPLDAFRLTAGGALLLGRVFSLTNIIVYGIGIVAASAFDRFLAARSPILPK